MAASRTPRSTGWRRNGFTAVAKPNASAMPGLQAAMAALHAPSQRVTFEDYLAEAEQRRREVEAKHKAQGELLLRGDA